MDEQAHISLETLAELLMAAGGAGELVALNPLLDFARGFVPRAQWPSTPLVLKATAGLRAVEPPDPELVKRYEAAKAPPIWTPDKDAPACQLCRRKFTTYYRRHHCRACGRCVCCDCSPKVCWQTTSRRCKRCVPPPARSIPGLGLA